MSFHVTFEAILCAKGLFTPIAGTKERSLTYSGRNQQMYQSNQRYKSINLWIPADPQF